jgi:hypothetical protein
MLAVFLYDLLYIIRLLEHIKMGGKKEMTWLQLVNMKLKARQAKGEHPSIKDVAAEAKKEWTQIKAGKHPLYVQGKAVITRKKKKTDTTKKSRKQRGSATTRKMVDVSRLEGKLCKKCMKVVHRMSEPMRGGAFPVGATADDFSAKPSNVDASVGTINPTLKNPLHQAQCGGKGKKKKQRTMKKKGGCGCGVLGGGGDGDKDNEDKNEEEEETTTTTASAASPTETDVKSQDEEKKQDDDEEKEEEHEEEEHEEEEHEEKEEEDKPSTPSSSSETDDEDEDDE